MKMLNVFRIENTCKKTVHTLTYRTTGTLFGYRFVTQEYI